MRTRCPPAVGPGVRGGFTVPEQPESLAAAQQEGAAETELAQKVEAVLDEIRPAIQMDGGDVQLVEVTEDGVVRLTLVGACVGCPMSMLTLQAGISRILRQRIPEITDVEAV